MEVKPGHREQQILLLHFPAALLGLPSSHPNRAETSSKLWKDPTSPVAHTSLPWGGHLAANIANTV